MFKITTTDPGFVSLSTRTYHLLLTFYPNRFRREYGPHMAQVFRDCCLNAYRQSGSPGMLALWAHTLFDWFKTVIEEQLNRGTDMTQTKFIRLSSWALIIGAIISAFSHLLGLQGNFSFLLFLIFPALVFIGLGTWGLREKYRDQIGSLAHLCIRLSIFSGALALIGIMMGSFYRGGHVGWGSVYEYGEVGQLLFLAAFGISTLRKKILPSWIVFPFSIGVLMVSSLQILKPIVGEILFGPGIFGVIFVFGLVLPYISLIIIGFRLQAKPEHPGSAHPIAV